MAFNKKMPPAVLNSSTCPEAWSFLYRLCRDGEKKGVPEDILQAWRSPGPARNKLLHDFVQKCFNKEVDASTNRARLEAFVKIRQASKDWKRDLKGYEWLTEEEMKEKGWSEPLEISTAIF